MAIATPANVTKDRISKPDLYGGSEMDPGRDALELLNQMWLKEPGIIGLPIDPFRISNELGIRVLRDDELPADIAGILRKDAGQRDPVIHLNEKDPRERRRFTCAHALGHYSRNVELGRDGTWDFVEDRDFFAVRLADVEEAYATQFAAEFLMPSIAFRAITDNPTVAVLADTFGVTGDIMRFRLDQIGWRR
jgi:Zn-dependent peptidase ImmA (M78 family)